MAEMTATATKGYIGCWTCRQPATHVFTRVGSETLHACDNCTRIDREDAEGHGWTVEPLTATHREDVNRIQDCTCIEFCDEDPRTACSLSGERHVHPIDRHGEFGPCPIHPDAPGDL